MLSYRVNSNLWQILNDSIILFWLLEDTSINRRTWDFLQSHWTNFYYEDLVIRRRPFCYKDKPKKIKKKKKKKERYSNKLSF